MDIESFKNDLRQAAKRLPPEVLNTIATVLVPMIAKYKPVLDVVVPAMKADLMPHFSAAMMESAMGILNKEPVEKAIFEVLSGFGLAKEG